MENDVTKQWDAAAHEYSRVQAKSPFARFNRGFVKHLLPQLAGKTVLDAGCGDGYYTNYFWEQGALASSCDSSVEMVRLAREKYPYIQFDFVELQNQLPYHDQQFDMVFCNLVLMDIEDIETFSAEVARILKPNGTFIFSILHPCFYVGKWETDKLGRKTYRKIFDYLGHQTIKTNFWGETPHYHRPISYYLNLMARNNLFLKELHEPAMPEVDYNSYYKSRLTRSRIHLFTFIYAVKHHLLRTKPYQYEAPSTRIPFLVFVHLIKK